MQSTIRVFSVVAAVAATMSLALAVGPKWMTSYSDAAKLSKKSGKPILADFTGSDWCGWCIQLHKEVFDKPAFAQWAAKNVILLELDYPHSKPQTPALMKQNEKLANKYSIRGYPTILFLKHDGKVIGQSGYMEGGPSAWTRNASMTIKAKPVRSG